MIIKQPLNAVSRVISIFLLLITFLSSKAEIVSDFTKFNRDAEEVTISRKVTEVPEFAFAGCSRLRKVIFESGSRCRRIGAHAFYRCDNLLRVDTPLALRTIGQYAFAWCVRMEQIDLGNVNEIGPHAFAYCFSLCEANFSPLLKHIGNNAFCRCDSLTEITLPVSLRSLESYAFAGCSSLRRVSLPANASMLGELIFSGCDTLEVIRIPSSSPPPFDCASFIFDPDETDRHANCLLIVPEGTEEIYRMAPGWRLFRNICCDNPMNPLFGESVGNN